MPPAEQKITRADIEAKVAEIEAALNGEAEKAKPPLLAGGIVVTLLVILIAYFFGKKSGNKRSAWVEVTRL